MSLISKRALVTPIAKSSRVAALCNLRPVSILYTVSKILQVGVHKQLVKHLNQNKVVPEVQSIFREHLSTATALVKITDDIVQQGIRTK